jgi:hypothetical protein
MAEFAKLIAAVVGASDSPHEVQATEAARMSLSWVLEVDWDFYIRTGTITTAAGTAEYALNSRTNDIQHVRVSSGDSRPIKYIRRDEYDQVIWDQSSNSRFTHYTLQNLGSATEITFLPTPDAAETVTYEFFLEPSRRLTSASEGFIAEYMELPFILYAQMLVGQWRGKPQNWVNTQMALALDARKGAQARERHYDHDVRLISAEEHGVRVASLDVAPSYYERFVG